MFQLCAKAYAKPVRLHCLNELRINKKMMNRWKWKKLEWPDNEC